MARDQQRQERIERLKAVVREVPDFPKKGISFKDITTLIRDGACFSDAVDLLVEDVFSYEADVIMSAEARGFVVGAAMAPRLNCGLILVRKPGKLPWKTISMTYELEYGTDTLEMHEDSLQAGERVLIVDDVLATGGTVAALIQLVKQSQAVPVAACFLAELSFLKGRDKLEGIPVHSLITY